MVCLLSAIVGSCDHGSYDIAIWSRWTPIESKLIAVSAPSAQQHSIIDYCEFVCTTGTTSSSSVLQVPVRATHATCRHSSTSRCDV